MSTRRWTAAAALGVALAMWSCGGDDSPTNPNPNPGPGPGPNPTFDSGTLNTSAPTNTFVRTFADSGTFGYRCTIHAGMTASVRVSAAGADSPLVTITNFSFSPDPVDVRTGSYVKWVNTQGQHTVTRP